MSHTGDAQERKIWQLEAENASLRGAAQGLGELCDRYKAENAKLREQVERLQPKDFEGSVLDIADTVHMLRSEYDGDHEWDDVVVELALTKWGGDRWIVRGSRGEAWACDCLRTGYDEDAYEGSDDAEPIVNPTLIEAENAKLRDLICKLMEDEVCRRCVKPYRTNPKDGRWPTCDYDDRLRELGIEAEWRAGNRGELD